MGEAGRERYERLVETYDLDRFVVRIAGTVSELSTVVVTPTVDTAAGGEGATVRVARYYPDSALGLSRRRVEGGDGGDDGGDCNREGKFHMGHSLVDERGLPPEMIRPDYW
jgi:hypothetical protein